MGGENRRIQNVGHVDMRSLVNAELLQSLMSQEHITLDIDNKELLNCNSLHSNLFLARNSKY